MYTDLEKDFFQSLNGPQIWYLVKKKKGGRKWVSDF